MNCVITSDDGVTVVVLLGVVMLFTLNWDALILKEDPRLTMNNLREPLTDHEVCNSLCCCFCVDVVLLLCCCCCCCYCGGGVVGVVVNVV